jgi:tryptophan 7-halogenase
MKKKLAVIGLGTAGVQALCHFLAYTNDEWEVISVYNPDIKILGIGESTNPTFLTTLGHGLDYNYEIDNDALDATVKYGTMFKKWRDKDFLNPLITSELLGLGLKRHVAIHFNNFNLKDFAMPRLRSKWGDKFKEVEGNVDDLIDGDDQVTVIVDGQEHVFDYAMDCRGFPKDYTAYYVNYNAPLNHALIHSVTEFETFDYTGHRATVDGWMFEIPLKSRLTYGYLFDDRVTDVATARVNFAKEIGVPLEELSKTEFTFNSYYAKEVLGNRVIKNGNRAIFFEPMSANSLWTYGTVNRLFFDYITDQSVTKETVNETFLNNSASIEDIIYFMYHGGSTFDTPFWQKAKDYAQMRVAHSTAFERTAREFKDLHPLLRDNPKAIFSLQQPVWIFGPYNLAVIDKNFGYYHFIEPGVLDDILQVEPSNTGPVYEQYKPHS